MKAKNYLIIFFIVLALEIVGEFLWALKDIPFLVYIFKPLLMPLLIYYYVNMVKSPLKILIIALVFSFFGDVFLMFLPQSEHFFLAGLASFMLTHILYLVIFVKKVDSTKKSILWRRPHLALPFVLYGISLLLYLYRAANPKFLEMQIPVIVYASVIMIMVLAAIGRYERVVQKSFVWVLVGALLFMFSDTLIALNNFTEMFIGKRYLAKLFIMSLYAIGQLYIVKGIIAWQKETDA